MIISEIIPIFATMKEDKSIDRLAFLAEKYNVFDDSEEGLQDIMDHLTAKAYMVTTLMSKTDDIFALASYKAIDNEGYVIDASKQKARVDVSLVVFNKMVNADPSKNKMYTQWMLEVFTRYIKDGEYDEAERFFTEDLPLAEEYLNIFEKNKRKKKFKELNSNNFALKGVKDPTNINQYKSLSQLYDAVDPFIEKDPSNMEKLINKFVEEGKAEVPVRDRKFTVYIPKCEEASLIFGEFVGWCTAKKRGDMFEHYRSSDKYKKPNGEKSDIYIVIDNRFFTGALKTHYLYQIHFESNQVKDRIQSNESHKFFENVMLQSEGVSNFFHEVLTDMAKMNNMKRGVSLNTNNVYIDYLIKFGWTEALFDIIEDYTPIIRFVNRDVPKLPDISKFKNLTTLIIKGAKLHELHPSIGNLHELQELLIPNNKITALPKEIGKLKNLVIMNIIGNKIDMIPDEIKYLDKTNGGSLHRIAFKREEIGEANYQKLKQLLPSTKM